MTLNFLHKLGYLVVEFHTIQSIISISIIYILQRKNVSCEVFDFCVALVGNQGTLVPVQQNGRPCLLPQVKRPRYFFIFPTLFCTVFLFMAWVCICMCIYVCPYVYVCVYV